MSPTLERAVVRALGAKQAQLTVLAAEAVTENYHRVKVDVGDLFARHGHHPTMWLRLWFDDGGRAHQRAYTLVDADVDTGTAWLEFALHEGVAARWAVGARPGDGIEASLLGSKQPWAGETPRSGSPWERSVLVGGMACVPAINALLEAWHDADVVVLLERAHADDEHVRLRLGPHHRVERFGQPQEMIARVEDFALDRCTRFWVTAEAATTRAVTASLRKRHGVDKRRIVAQAYWTQER